MIANKSAAAILGRGFCGNRNILGKNVIYLVKDFADGSILEGNAKEISSFIGINKSCVSTYCRNNQVYKGRFRITTKEDPDWKTDMKKIKVYCN